MKKRRFKALIATLGVALTLGATAVFGGCNANTGRDGINGKDLNIYDVYEATKVETGNPNLTFAEFLHEYLSYTPEEISLQTAINRSLLSSVSVQTKFLESGLLQTYNGSGVIIDVDRASGDMTVVTNCHVVYSAKSRRYSSDDGYSDNIKLWLYGSESNNLAVYDGNAIPATLVAASKSYDVAVLKVTGSDIVKKSQAKAASWSNAEEVYLGETVYAIGNANSQTMSANVGYISKDLELVSVDLGTTANHEMFSYNVMRTSAAINSGNSGGGLFNIGAEIVGLVNAKSKEDAVGFGYALTAASTRRVVQSMLDSYEETHTEAHSVSVFSHGIIVEVADMYSTGLNENGFAEIVEKVQVVRTDNVSEFRDKLSNGDIIKHIKITRGNDDVVEDIDINREHNFHDAMLSVRAGDTVEITVERDGSDKTVSVTATSFKSVE